MTSTDEPLPHHHYTDEEMHNVDVAHEHGDVDIRAVLGFAAALALVVAIAAGLMYGLFWYVFERQARQNDPQVSPVAVQDQKPQGPPLLTNEPQNLRQFRQEETGKLDGYGWMNQSQGIAHVPIDLAKKLVVQHGLPVRTGEPADETLGTHAPAYGESSGGRTIPTKHVTAPAPGGEQQPPAVPQPASAGQEIKK